MAEMFPACNKRCQSAPRKVVPLRGIRGIAVTAVAAICLAVGGLFTAPVPSAAAFTGHGCTKASCSYFTSSYGSSHYYYNRATCSQWKSLTPAYLQGFKTSAALLARYSRVLHKRC
jgi:hypothetical protein